ncbi:MAG: hypothetical protein Tsb0015_02020 [Simkaniaceae bacterium]
MISAKKNYGGPCPPKGTGMHRYYFHLYALDKELNLKEGISAEELKVAMKDHIIQKAQYMGLYTKDR